MAARRWPAITVGLLLHLLIGVVFFFAALTIPAPQVYGLWAGWLVLLGAALFNLRRPLFLWLLPALDVAWFLVYLLILVIVAEA